MAKKSEENIETTVEQSVNTEVPKTTVEQSVNTEVPKETESPFDSVTPDMVESHFSQIASFVEQVNSGSMKKDTAVYLCWRLLSQIK